MDERVLRLLEDWARGAHDDADVGSMATRLLYAEPAYLGTYEPEEEVLLAIVHGVYQRDREERPPQFVPPNDAFEVTVVATEVKKVEYPTIPPEDEPAEDGGPMRPCPLCGHRGRPVDMVESQCAFVDCPHCHAEGPTVGDRDSDPPNHGLAVAAAVAAWDRREG